MGMARLCKVKRKTELCVLTLSQDRQWIFVNGFVLHCFKSFKFWGFIFPFFTAPCVNMWMHVAMTLQ